MVTACHPRSATAAAARPHERRVLAIPTKQRCGAPGYSCASAVDDQGNVHYYYEVEPVGVYLAEILVGTNIRLYYTSGDDVEKAR